MKSLIISICLLLGGVTFGCAQKKASAKLQKKNNVQVQLAHKKDSLLLDSVLKKANAGDAVAQNTMGTYYYVGKHVKNDYSMSAKWFALSAKKNNADAIGNLGLCYQKGNGVKKDSVMALNLYRKSVEAGNTDLLKKRMSNAGKDGPFDYIFVAQCYEQGSGVSKDMEKAINAYESAAKLSSSDGAREAALYYYNRNNYDKSAPLLKQAVKAGEEECLYPYAVSLKKGLGMDTDKQQASVYMIKAAQSGNHLAQNDLGTMYLKGEGVAKSESSAYSWYRESSVDVPWAMWNAGLCCLNGYGTDVNYDQALYWFADAAQSAPAFMKNFKSKLQTKEDAGWAGTSFIDYINGMKYFVINKNFDDAEKSFKLVEKAKNMAGTTMLGVCYNSKDWKKYNQKKAVKYFTEASDAGDVKAKFLLAKMYEEGNGVTKDADKALKMITEASDAGYAPAQSYLGDMYFEGKGVEHSDLAAAQCYSKAYKNGGISSSSLKRLADYYEQGKGGLKKDVKMAKKLNTKAMKQDSEKALLNSVND